VTAARLRWEPVIDRAAAIVQGYDTLVTLRQLFYRLVSEGMLPNTKHAYQHLSRLTAEARREGWFPALFDRTRVIHRPPSWPSLNACLAGARRGFRLDRTEGQAANVVLAVEKHGLVELLLAWFGGLGLPVVALGGYPSQSCVDQVAGLVADDTRPAVLLYGGDFDPSGEDIGRDFIRRTGCWAEVRRVALTPEQVAEHDLPVMMGKATDSRANGFTARHGQLVQVELDALPPDTLRRAYEDALAQWWDDAAYAGVLAAEERQLDGPAS